MSNDHRKLLRGATILTMDPAIGDLDRGDVLIEGTEIAAVAATIEVGEDVEVIDATGRIVVPGFVDTHRHMWEALARGCAPHHSLEQYYTDVLGKLGPALKPEDVYAGTLDGMGVTLEFGWSGRWVLVLPHWGRLRRCLVGVNVVHARCAARAPR